MTRTAFDELSETQVREMMNDCIGAAVAYAKRNRLGGLSTSTYNVYRAIQDAIFSEWRYAVSVRERLDTLADRDDDAAIEQILSIQQECQSR